MEEYFEYTQTLRIQNYLTDLKYRGIIVDFDYIYFENNLFKVRVQFVYPFEFDSKPIEAKDAEDFKLRMEERLKNENNTL